MSYRLLILAGTLLLQFHQLFLSHKKRSKKLALLHKIIEMIPLSPTQLINKLTKIGGLSEIIAICKGTVTAGETTTSILNPAKKVLFSKLYGSDVILGPSPRKRLLQAKEPSYLKVFDDKQSINIYESHRSYVVPTKLVTLSNNRSLFDELKSKFKHIFSRQSNFTFPDLNYSIFGNENIQQHYAPDPSQFAILGKFKKEASEVCCYEPTLISPSKERMIALIQEDLAGDQVQRVVLVLVLTITVGIIIKELWNLYQKHKCKTVNLYDNLKKIFIKSRVCSICKSNLSCMLSKSCMHMTTCQTCWEKQKEVCNECNRTVKDIVEMYVC